MSNLYISGSLGTAAFRPQIYAMTKHRLLSLHASYLETARRFVMTVGDHTDTLQMNLMLDSGAFSAWNKNQPDIEVSHLLKTYVGVKKYCESRFKDVFFINLDKIPGAPGRTATQEEIADAVRISDDNYAILKAELGDKVLPVFHQSESEERLRQVIGLNPSYVCISPRNDLHEKDRRRWSQRVHELTGDTKTHGLAATSGDMMLEVPWHSIDSASWIQGAAYGLIAVPYLDSINWLAVSEHASARRKWGSHADTADPATSKRIDTICAECGITRADLREKLGARELFNVYMITKISQQPPKPAKIEGTLFAL